MARARTLKPSFFTNEDLVELHPLTRLFFAGLWCHADRDGRLEDRPKRLKMAILPADDWDAEAALQSLADRNLILRYEVDGCRYIVITTFHEHQKPHPRETPSEIPAPQNNTKDNLRQTLDLPKQSQGDLTILLSHNLELEREVVEKGESEGENEASPNPEPSAPDGASVTAPRKSNSKQDDSDFEAFYSAYPRKKHRLDALKAWRQVKAIRPPLAVILEAISPICEQYAADPIHVKYPASWLRAGGWDDVPDVVPPGISDASSITIPPMEGVHQRMGITEPEWRSVHLQAAVCRRQPRIRGVSVRLNGPTHELRPRDSDEILTVAPILTDSGLVDWCPITEPEYIGASAMEVIQ